MGRKPAFRKKKTRKKTKFKWKIRWPKIKANQILLVSVLSVLIFASIGILIYLRDSEERMPPTLPPVEAEKALLPPLEPEDVAVKSKPLEKAPLKKIEKAGPAYKIAIIIDDLGNNKEMFDKLLKMNVPFSFSVLPHQNYSLYISKETRKGKHDLLLHLPMEPEDNKKAIGEGIIMSRMTPNEMLKQLDYDLKAVPDVIGVNNHMGSLLTQDKKAMAIVLGEIKRKGLFFVDSRTTSKTVAYEVAKKLGLKTAERNVFLDDIEDEQEIIKQIELLISTAKRNGRAIGIGHPRPQTIAALEKMLPALKTDGIEIVPVSRLVN